MDALLNVLVVLRIVQRIVWQIALVLVKKTAARIVVLHVVVHVN